MSTIRHLAAVAGCGFALCSIPVFAIPVYTNDFQGTVGSEWSQTIVASAPNPDYADNRRFLGEFGNDNVTLSLTGLAPHTSITLSFQIYLLRSWDGNDTTIVNGDPLGRDYWHVGVAGAPTLLNATFSNGNPAGQTYDGAFSTYTSTPWTPCTAYSGYSGPGPNGPMTGANECYSLGYTFTYPDGGPTESMDSVYNLSFTFAHTDSSLSFVFGANGLQGLADESWGLDNVSVDAVVVPLPGALPLLASGIAAFGWVGRRKAASA